jgi:hypothetical protein
MEINRIHLNKRLACGGMARPIVCIGDANDFIKTLIENEPVFNNLGRENFVIEKRDHVHLDPGGIASADGHWSDVLCQGVKFVVPTAKVMIVINRIYECRAHDKEIGSPIPFLVYPGHTDTMFIPHGMVDDLITHLLGLATTDEAITREKTLKDNYKRMREHRDPDSCPGL